MPSATLTQKVVDSAKGGSVTQPLFLWDTLLPGFGLRVTPSVRSFVVQQRDALSHATRRVTLGRYPQMTVEAARDAAKRILVPANQSHGAHTVATLMQSFIPNYIEKRHKPKTRRTELQLIRQHILPHLGSHTLSELTPAVIVEWHSTQISAPIAANRALAHLSKACSYAIQRDWMKYNPCKAVERNKERTRDRFFSDTELTRLFTSLKQRSDNYGCFVTLALTGMRVGELVSDMNVDSDRKVIWLNDSKTGSKSIPLNDTANSFMQRFPLIRIPTYWVLRNDFKVACLDARLTGVSIHTLRHTLATYMAQHGDSAFQIAAMGGWRSLSMVQRYVTLHGVGTPCPTPAGDRIAKALGLGSDDSSESGRS